MSTERTRYQRQRLNEIHAKIKGTQKLAREQLNKRLLSLLALYDDTVDELADLVVEIRESQEYQSGAILLEFTQCSNEACIGCPHPRWKKWHYKTPREDDPKGFWISVKIDSPKRHARAKRVPEEARDAIARAVFVIKQREALMAQLRSIGRTVMNLEESRFDQQ